ncbi:glycine cleavage system H protein, mitochondrial precursor [Lophiostoma macrostomum CBS 122681]|uniref:Glycine cleavage system H protein n=1 Tax=Lophiostoma macrostomum CBS 122681 TaxID=1314788 RepID=A0A6A6SUR0_9PLEO|nr:glycine cleavage system H protein, mitochondrial precursor [Lophiostoma macrostomum CBS 122681]
MAARLSVARAARQLTSSAARRPATAYPVSCQRWQKAPIQSRLFTVSAQWEEKKYTEDHEWVELSADGKTATLGISTYAAKALGDIVFCELPQVGVEFSSGDAIGAVESVKSASDILTPISGEVVEVNSALEEVPGGINKDPEGEGWIAKIAVQAEPEGLMSAEEYKKHTEEA